MRQAQAVAVPPSPVQQAQAVAVPPSPVQEDIAGLLQVMHLERDIQREQNAHQREQNQTALAATQANAAATRDNRVAIGNLSSDLNILAHNQMQDHETIGHISSGLQDVTHRQELQGYRQQELINDQREDRERNNASQAQQRQRNDEFNSRIANLERSMQASPSAFGANGPPTPMSSMPSSKSPNKRNLKDVDAQGGPHAQAYMATPQGSARKRIRTSSQKANTQSPYPRTPEPSVNLASRTDSFPSNTPSFNIGSAGENRSSRKRNLPPLRSPRRLTNSPTPPLSARRPN